MAVLPAQYTDRRQLLEACRPQVVVTAIYGDCQHFLSAIVRAETRNTPHFECSDLSARPSRLRQLA